MYSGLRFEAQAFPPWIQEIRLAVGELCGVPDAELPNSCNVNLYSDHAQGLGWHSDDEVYFQGLLQDVRILSFSLGAAREFSWRLQGTTETAGTTRLGHGDLMTMEGKFQKHYKHCVPPSDEAR